MKPAIKLLFMALSALNFYATNLHADTLDLWFAPNWKTKTDNALHIASSLSEKSGITVNARIAQSYPQIFDEFKSSTPTMVYVGSFAQALIRARKLGDGIVQAKTGKEFYSGVLIYPSGQDPKAILQNTPEKIAFAVGASSGESSAAAATGGKASFKTKSHLATAGAVKAGRAAAGVVKNWWWQANANKFPSLSMYEIPGVSEPKNPDNVLVVSTEVSAEIKAKIASAAKASASAFNANSVVDFEPSSLDFSLALMKKGNIDPESYPGNWLFSPPTTRF